MHKVNLSLIFTALLTIYSYLHGMKPTEISRPSKEQEELLSGKRSVEQVRLFNGQAEFFIPKASVLTFSQTLHTLLSTPQILKEEEPSIAGKTGIESIDMRFIPITTLKWISFILQQASRFINLNSLAQVVLNIEKYTGVLISLSLEEKIKLLQAADFLESSLIKSITARMLAIALKLNTITWNTLINKIGNVSETTKQELLRQYFFLFNEQLKGQENFPLHSLSSHVAYNLSVTDLLEYNRLPAMFLTEYYQRAEEEIQFNILDLTNVPLTTLEDIHAIPGIYVYYISQARGRIYIDPELEQQLTDVKKVLATHYKTGYKKYVQENDLQNQYPEEEADEAQINAWLDQVFATLD